MVRPDDGAVDHVGGAIPTGHLGQGLQHRIEHAGLDPAPVASEHAVPLPIFIRQMPPLRTRPGDPHHPFKIGPIITRRTATTSPFRRKKRSDQRPFFIRHTNPLAQACLPKSSLESTGSHSVKLCPRNLAEITGRAGSNLSRTLKTMESYGLVRFEPGHGRKLAPKVVHDRVELALPLIDRAKPRKAIGDRP